MEKLLKQTLSAAKKYNAWDYAWLKTCLVALGIILGAYFSSFFLKYITVVWVIAIITYIWIIYKTFVKYKV